VVLRLTAPGGSLTRPRQPSSGPAPAIPPLLMGRHGRPTSCPPPQRVPRLPVCRTLAMAASGTPTSFCTRFSLHDSAQQEPSAAPPALHELLYQSLQAALIPFKPRSSRLNQPQPGNPSRAGCLLPATRPGRALRRGPVACRLPTGLASREQAAGPAGGCWWPPQPRGCIPDGTVAK
jgi:hypothetical protein